jgi:hypothetical protein
LTFEINPHPFKLWQAARQPVNTAKKKTFKFRGLNYVAENKHKLAEFKK